MPGHSTADHSVRRLLKALVLVAAEQVFHNRRRVGMKRTLFYRRLSLSPASLSGHPIRAVLPFPRRP